MTKKIPINENDIVDLQRCSIDLESRKELISFMITNNMDISSSNFKQYEKEYQELFYIYQQFKIDFENNVIKQRVQEKVLSWHVDFNTCELTVEVENND